MSTEPRTIRDVDLKALLLVLLLLAHKLIVVVKTCLALGLAPFGIHADPLQFTLQGLTALANLLLLLNHPLGFLVEPARVVSLPRNSLAPIELENPFGHIIKKVAVVRYGNNSTLVLLQVML